MARVCLSLLLLLVTNCIARPLEEVPSSNGSMIPQLMPHSNLILNIQELADLALNPTLDNQSLMDLYEESVEIINGTTADSVLYELDPLVADNTSSPIMVLAVYNPVGPSHQDLLDQFQMYFVNLTESESQSVQTRDASTLTTVNDLVVTKNSGTWSIMQNFFKNQLNAVVGALWLPYNVGALAMQETSSEHSQFVESGSTIGKTLFNHIQLKAINLPNNISQRIVRITIGGHKLIQSAEHHSKVASGQVLDAAASGVESAAHATAQLTEQYLVRPLGAFAGMHLNRTGHTLAELGSRLDGASIHLTWLGERLDQGSLKAVDAGASAIAWGYDSKVVLPGEQPTDNGAQAKHVST